MPTARPGDAGETFVEVLIALVIAGLAISALVTGLGAASRASGLHRSESDAHTYLVKFAEQVKAANYDPTCSPAAYVPALSGLPTGWTITPTIEYWNATTSSFGSTCLDAPVSLAKVGAVVTSSGLSTIKATAPSTPLANSMAGMQLRFTSGSNSGLYQAISAVDTSATTLLTAAFPVDAAVGDTFVIEHRTAFQMQRVTLSSTSPEGLTDALSVVKRNLR